MPGMYPDIKFATQKVYTEPAPIIAPHAHEWDLVLEDGKIIAWCKLCPATLSYTEVLVELNSKG